MNRDELLQNIRPILDVESDGVDISEFMHSTLRPILKFQHDTLVTIIRADKNLTQILEKQTTIDQKRSELKSYLESSKPIRYTLIGNVVGLFTADELNTYLDNRRELDKRTLQMIVTRFVSIC